MNVFVICASIWLAMYSYEWMQRRFKRAEKPKYTYTITVNGTVGETPLTFIFKAELLAIHSIAEDTNNPLTIDGEQLD